MTDVVDRRTRSRMMAGVRGKDTKPELIVRSHLHRSGLRFRVHAKELPGCPDILLPRWGVALFVHGCFWHHHPGCSRAYVPKTRRRFWKDKFEANVRRDDRDQRALRRVGWRVFIVWECELETTRLNRLTRAIVSHS